MNVSNNYTESKLSYKARARAAKGSSKYPRARFGISVGKEYHEGEKLRAALDWAKTRFDNIEVRVSDTLQRYNFLTGTPEENRNIARIKGDEWIERNRHILATVPDLFLFRWDDVLSDPEFPAHYDYITRKTSEPLFRQAMADDISAYVSRTGRETNICMDYLIEELAVFNLLQDRRPATDIYPGTFLTCRKILRGDFSLIRLNFEKCKIEESRAA